VFSFADAWASCFSYDDYLFPSVSSPEALQFQSPHMVGNPNDVREAFSGFQASMLSARDAFRRLIAFVLGNYAEIDFDGTNKAAFEMLKDTWPEETSTETSRPMTSPRLPDQPGPLLHQPYPAPPDNSLQLTRLGSPRLGLHFPFQEAAFP